MLYVSVSQTVYSCRTLLAVLYFRGTLEETCSFNACFAVVTLHAESSD